MFLSPQADVRVYKSDPPLPGSLGKDGRNDFHEYPLGYGPKASVMDDSLSSSSESSAKGRGRKGRMKIEGKPCFVSPLFFLYCNNFINHR